MHCTTTKLDPISKEQPQKEAQDRDALPSVISGTPPFGDQCFSTPGELVDIFDGFAELEVVGLP